MVPTANSQIPPKTRTARLCQKLVGNGAHDVDGLLLGLDDVAGLGILGQALEGADELACTAHVANRHNLEDLLPSAAPQQSLAPLAPLRCTNHRAGEPPTRPIDPSPTQLFIQEHDDIWFSPMSATLLFLWWPPKLYSTRALATRLELAIQPTHPIHSPARLRLPPFRCILFFRSLLPLPLNPPEHLSLPPVIHLGSIAMQEESH